MIGGGLTPALAQMMADRGGLAPVGLYLAAAAVLSLIGLIAAGRTNLHVDPLAAPGM